MSKGTKSKKHHKFSNKLLLNQWLVSLFGIDPLHEHELRGRKNVRPFRVLIDPIMDQRMEGLDHDNLHKFYHNLVGSNLFWNDYCRLSKELLLKYEENIARHTLQVNERRGRAVVWKYYQWLCLLFAEIYLDRYFHDRDGLLDSLNGFIDRFNEHWSDFADVPPYQPDDLNKLSIQMATGSGKTLLMHVNILQYRHYAKESGRDQEIDKTILVTPNERLSEQHIAEFHESGFMAEHYLNGRGRFAGTELARAGVDVLEVTKLADQEGPNTIATRSLGDQNLLLVDEGHRGMSGKEEGAWLGRRASLCAKGFTIEYSATFEQAVAAANREDFTNSYAKSVLFDYSYRWFYEDGFGKDYQILNLPRSLDNTQKDYLTACLLKFYQQLRIYETGRKEFVSFNLEKPLWVFVGSTVTKAKGSKDEKAVAADVALIIMFIADCLNRPGDTTRRIGSILTGKGRDTGLLDREGRDIFAGSFSYLIKAMTAGETVEEIWKDILRRLFNNVAGGQLVLAKLKGDSGEILLQAGASEEVFGLINVGDAKGLCDHIEEIAAETDTKVLVTETDFSDPVFATVKDSSSPINILIGSKKFVEGWDCWRVSTMGLMHVGKSEGAQIIQLFGRGVRLKGYDWSLKRSGRTLPAMPSPGNIVELETLNVFGVEADFMERFREFLKEEGLPGNERRQIFTIPLNVTYDFGKKLMILRPKRKTADGREYDFKKDAPVPAVGEVPDHFHRNKVVADWYPRIQAIQSRTMADKVEKDQVNLEKHHLALLDYDELFFELERFKRERAWFNLNISKGGIRSLLADPSWYCLYMPETRMNPTSFEGWLLIQQVAAELLKRYCHHYYNHKKSEFLEPRLELRELTRDDENIPKDDQYQLIVDESEDQLIQSIVRIKKDLADNKGDLLQAGDLRACNFGNHLYQPLFHVRRGGEIAIVPVALNDSEYQFIIDLKKWCGQNAARLTGEQTEIFVLRNISRGKGVGFFEAGNFHPDFIMWVLMAGKQYVCFIEPHGLMYEGPGSEKIQFCHKIKDVEARLGDPLVILESFILSVTDFNKLLWHQDKSQLEKMHVLFMKDDPDEYIDKLFSMLSPKSI